MKRVERVEYIAATFPFHFRYTLFSYYVYSYYRINSSAFYLALYRQNEISHVNLLKFVCFNSNLGHFMWSPMQLR